MKSSGVELLFYIRPSLSDGKGFEVHSRLVEGNLLLSKTLIFHQTLLKKQRKKVFSKGKLWRGSFGTDMGDLVTVEDRKGCLVVEGQGAPDTNHK